MLSLYPDLYNYAGFVPVVFRLFLGYFLFKTAFENFMISKRAGGGMGVILWSGIPLIGGILLVLGLLVQPTAFILAILFIVFMNVNQGVELAHLRRSNDFHLLLILTLLSLIFLGPGIWAIDLPL